MTRYLNTTEGAMFAVLLGGKGALAHHHAVQAYHRLARAIEGPESAAISCEAQQAASDFIYAHGTRAARGYARALQRLGATRE